MTDPETPTAGSPQDPAAPSSHHDRGEAGALAMAAAAARRDGAEEKGPWRRLLKDIRSGVRISVLLGSDLEPSGSTASRLAWLSFADLVLNLVVSFLLVGADGNFSYPAVTSFFFHLPLFLLFGLFAGRLLSRPSLVPGIASALVALSIPIELVHALFEGAAQLRSFEWVGDYLTAPHYYRFFWWWSAAALLFLFRLDTGTRWRRMRLPLVFALLVLPPLWYYPRGDLWVSPAAASESGEFRLTEEVLSAQEMLLDRDLAALKPGRPFVTDLYFVGFAGDASQDVFLKELSFARRLFDERFGSSGRSVLLANNPKSGTTLPFATSANLGRALARVGEVMNRDEDILFLYISSHGSKEHELEVNNPPLELKSLTPEGLRRLLDKSGVKWKVVVVSACFSGGFVAPLQDDGSLVITASDATHESFGCGFGEEFTWFGQAFLGEALTESLSFTAAFEKARETIGKWEEERGETPSNPQIRAGKGIWPKLEKLEEELQVKSN